MSIYHRTNMPLVDSMLALVSGPHEHSMLTGVGLQQAYDMRGLTGSQQSGADHNLGLCLIEDKLQWCELQCSLFTGTSSCSTTSASSRDDWTIPHAMWKGLDVVSSHLCLEKRCVRFRSKITVSCLLLLLLLTHGASSSPFNY